MKLAASLIALCFLPIAIARAGEPVMSEEPALGKAFAKEHATGTFVLLDSSTKTLRVWNVERARQRFIPASTFKIANSLIGLDTGTVKDLDEVLP
jgi:beta-lactamase class D